MNKIRGCFVSLSWLAIFAVSISILGQLHEHRINPEFNSLDMNPAQTERYQKIVASKTLLRVAEDEAGMSYALYRNKDTPDFLFYQGWILDGDPIILTTKDRKELGELGTTQVLTSVFRSKEMVVGDFNWTVEVLPLVLLGSLAMGSYLLVTLGSRFGQLIGLILGLGSSLAWGFDVSFAYGLAIGLTITQIITFSYRNCIGVILGGALGCLASFFLGVSPGFVFNFDFGFYFGITYGLSFSFVFGLIQLTKKFFAPIGEYLEMELSPDPDKKDFLFLPR